MKKFMLLTYLVHNGVLIYLQKGALSSKVATFLKAYLAAFMIFWGSELSVIDLSKHPNLASRATLPIPTIYKEN